MLTMMTGLALGSVLAPSSSAATQPETVRLIFDTDMGNDIDDALALAMIHALESRDECKLLAVTITKDNRYSAPFVDLVNTFYGRPDIPVGVVRDGVTPKDSRFTREPSQARDDGKPRYPHKLRDGSEAPEAVGLLRRVLAEQPDGSVAMVQVGFSTNFARLLTSQPDDASPLPGSELVREKVRLLSIMAGAFDAKLTADQFKEYNIREDLPSSRKLLAEWPTPIVISGFEIGRAILYPARSIRNDFGYVAHHPIREAYELYQEMPYDRPTWDLTSVLYAVRPDHGYFELSPPGKIQVSEDGVTRFEEQADGKHRYLKVQQSQIARIREAMELLCSQPPSLTSW